MATAGAMSPLFRHHAGCLTSSALQLRSKAGRSNNRSLITRHTGKNKGGWIFAHNKHYDRISTHLVFSGCRSDCNTPLRRRKIHRKPQTIPLGTECEVFAKAKELFRHWNQPVDPPLARSRNERTESGNGLPNFTRQREVFGEER